MPTVAILWDTMDFQPTCFILVRVRAGTSLV